MDFQSFKTAVCKRAHAENKLHLIPGANLLMQLWERKMTVDTVLRLFLKQQI